MLSIGHDQAHKDQVMITTYEIRMTVPGDQLSNLMEIYAAIHENTMIHFQIMGEMVKKVVPSATFSIK